MNSTLTPHFQLEPFFNHPVLLPFLRNGLWHCATLPGCVDDFNVIGGELDQIPQGAGLNDGRVGDEVLLKIHRLHRLCEGNLREKSEERAKSISCENSVQLLLFTSVPPSKSSAPESILDCLEFGRARKGAASASRLST